MHRKTRKEKKRLVFITITVIVLLVSLVASVYSDFLEVINNKREVAKLQQEYDSLVKEEGQLNSEVTKMQNPDYIARYAKEKYLYSEQDETIIRID